MGTRDAKNWLEAITLNDTTLAGDSTTDVVTEHAVKTYVDNHSSEPFDPVDSLTLTHLNSPFDASAGNAYTVDASIAGVIINLPSVGPGDRILIHAVNAANTITLNAQSGESVQGQSTLTLGHAQSLWLIGSIDHDSAYVWTPGNTATNLMVGHETLEDVAYKVIEILSNQGDITTTCTVSAAGQEIVTESDSGTFTEEITGVDDTTFKVTADTNSNDIANVTLTGGDSRDISLRAQSNGVMLISTDGTLIHQHSSGGVGIGIGGSSTSPLRVDTGLAVYLDNTAAIAGGLVAGDVYRHSNGELRVVC